METLFIADDERSIRDGLKYIIDWEALGFTLCGEAANGEEALSKLLSLKPSLALLDVRMPKMLGTEVIRRARAAGFEGKCIILSGYSDFTYAQEAIQSQVSFYLTKPLDEDDLLKAVQAIKASLEQESKSSSHIQNMRTKAKSVILKELFSNQLEQPLSKEDCDTLHLSADSFQVVICENTNKGNDSYTSFAEVLKLANRSNHTLDVIRESNREIILLKGAFGLGKLSDMIDHLDNQPQQEGSLFDSIFFTFGKPVSSLDQLHISYEEATNLFSRRFFCPQNQRYLGYDTLPCSEKNTELNQDTMMKYANSMTEYIKSFNRKMMVGLLCELEDCLVASQEDVAELKLMITDLYLQVKELIHMAYPTATLPFISNSMAIQKIHSANYLYEIIQFLSETFENIMNATGNPSRDTILDDILYYIDHNFKGNIKLETIAPLFGYNSAYLGKIFHKAVGENFNSYVDHCRINASKELLLNGNLKVYEIAEQVGYKNVDYFHKKFKKYVGESPAEYRKRMES